MVALGAALMLIASTVLVGCGDGKNSGGSTTTSRRAPTRHLAPNAIRIQWKPQALRRATRSGRLCITTVKTGHFCAQYSVGQIPATALRIKLLEHGYIPITVKRRR
jgi:hypothetical protein